MNLLSNRYFFSLIIFSALLTSTTSEQSLHAAGDVGSLTAPTNVNPSVLGACAKYVLQVIQFKKPTAWAEFQQQKAAYDQFLITRERAVVAVLEDKRSYLSRAWSEERHIKMLANVAVARITSAQNIAQINAALTALKFAAEPLVEAAVALRIKNEIAERFAQATAIAKTGIQTKAEALLRQEPTAYNIGIIAAESLKEIRALENIDQILPVVQKFDQLADAEFFTAQKVRYERELRFDLQNADGKKAFVSAFIDIATKLRNLDANITYDLPTPEELAVALDSQQVASFLKRELQVFRIGLKSQHTDDVRLALPIRMKNDLVAVKAVVQSPASLAIRKTSGIRALVRKINYPELFDSLFVKGAKLSRPLTAL